MPSSNATIEDSDGTLLSSVRLLCDDVIDVIKKAKRSPDHSA
jgi:hypothetical protein